jgi:hypothetical protein
VQIVRFRLHLELLGPEPNPSRHSFRNSRTAKMEDATCEEETALIHSRQRYLDVPEATKLNTVDIWTRDSEPATKGDGKSWIMSVLPLHSRAFR